MTDQGPTLAEQEALHDGEPVFAMAWGASQTRGAEAAATCAPPPFAPRRVSNRKVAPAPFGGDLSRRRK